MKELKTGVIAFCGSKGSGKSTSASIFKDIFNGPTEELAFAGHLKEVCSKVFNIDMKYFIDPKLKEVELDSYIRLTPELIEEVFKLFNVISFEYDKHIRPHIGQVFSTPRSLLQYIGTEVLHPIDPLIHVKVTMAKKDNTKLSIITDLRFIQEFDHLFGRTDFMPIYVYNLSAEAAAASDMHASEQQLKHFRDRCLRIDNNQSLSQLTQNLKHIVSNYYEQTIDES